MGLPATPPALLGPQDVLAKLPTFSEKSTAYLLGSLAELHLKVDPQWVRVIGNKVGVNVYVSHSR